jgi:hypothetical protein
MGSISNVPNGISYVAAALGGASSCSSGNCSTGGTNSQSLQQTLQSATPSDAVQLSFAAVQLQQVEGIFGQSPSSTQDSQPSSLGVPGSAPLAPGVTSNDLARATPDQLAILASQSQALTQQASLFTPTPNYQNNLNVLA